MDSATDWDDCGGIVVSNLNWGRNPEEGRGTAINAWQR